MENSLYFKGNNPGAVRHGNFINYYKFNPPQERLELFSSYLRNLGPRQSITCLDVGCNAGDLTQMLYELLSRNLCKNVFLHSSTEEQITASSEGVPSNICHILGVDLDPVLIQRANLSNKYPSNVTYMCCDLMQDEGALPAYLNNHNKTYFDIVFCFSVTMWIHLNHGDAGLKTFLHKLSHMCKMLVIEPQPWKCYRSAVRRMKLCGETFPEYSSLKMRGSVESDIEKFICEECNMIKTNESSNTKWGRKLLFFATDI